MKINARKNNTHNFYDLYFFKLKRTEPAKSYEKYFSQMFNNSSSMTVVSSVEKWNEGEKLLNFLYHKP